MTTRQDQHGTFTRALLCIQPFTRIRVIQLNDDQKTVVNAIVQGGGIELTFEDFALETEDMRLEAHRFAAATKVRLADYIVEAPKALQVIAAFRAPIDGKIQFAFALDGVK